MIFRRKIKNGPSKQGASKAHISSDFQDLGCGKFFYQYGDLHFVAPLAGLGLHQSGHHINEDTGGKILARTGLFLVGVLLQQTFVQVAQPLFPGGVPVQAVNGGDDLFQVLGFVDVGGGALVNLPHPAGAVFA